MDFQDFLGLSAASMAAVFVVHIFVSGAYRNTGAAALIALYAAVIAITVAGARFFPEIYGYISALSFLIAVAPGWMHVLARDAWREGRNAVATRWMWAAAILQPTQLMRFSANLFQAASEPVRERRIAAFDALTTTAPAFMGPVLDVLKLRAAEDWNGVAAYMEMLPPQTFDLLADHGIRAFGETGQLDSMMAAYRRYCEQPGGKCLRIAKLTVLAFSGCADAAHAWLEKNFRGMPPELKIFWRATALQAAGKYGDAQKLLESCKLDNTSAPIREGILSRLAKPAMPVSPLSPESSSILSAVEAEALSAPVRKQPIWRNIPITLILIASCLVFYAAQLYIGHPRSMDTLFRLGALWPDAVLEDQQWWRLVTALFLHSGPEHLFSNMLALWVLGGFIETRLGWWRMLTIYFAGGLASMGGVLWLMHNALIETNFLVGASGAILALLGALVFIRLRDYLRFKTVSDQRNLTMVGAVLAIQFFIDMAMPRISMSAHALGLLSGIILGWLLTPKHVIG